jgi:hypothetical protein
MASSPSSPVLAGVDGCADDSSALSLAERPQPADRESQAHAEGHRPEIAMRGTPSPAAWIF